VIELCQGDFNGSFGVSAHPGNLLGLLEVLICLVNGTEKDRVAISTSLLLANGNVSPLHQGNFLTDLNADSIVFLDIKVTTINDSF
jgi:hypothetical protein